MVKYILAFFVFISNLCLANMASPIQEGTHAITAISSKDIAILNENIRISIDKYFNKAFYQVEYTIRTESGGVQIPLLFHARDYLGKFKVWLDGKAVELKEVPLSPQDTLKRFDGFSDAFRKTDSPFPTELLVRYDVHSGRYFPLSDFVYFEVDLSKGAHQISVEYVGGVWADRSGWLKKYSFRYFLSPAREWKSFHELHVSIDASAFKETIHSNLGKPDSGSLKQTAHWTFKGIPSDYIELSYQPKPNNFAGLLIGISPLGLTLIFGLVLILLHIGVIRFLIKRSKMILSSFVVVAGSILIPFVILAGYTFSYDVIDSAIGMHAGRYHGYTFLVVFLYVIVMPVYWLGIHQITTSFKRSFARKL